MDILIPAPASSVGTFEQHKLARLPCEISLHITACNNWNVVFCFLFVRKIFRPVSSYQPAIDYGCAFKRRKLLSETENQKFVGLIHKDVPNKTR